MVATLTAALVCGCAASPGVAPTPLRPAASPEAAGGRPALAAPASSAVSAESLRVHLFAIAADSMLGRGAGGPGAAKTAAWIARSFAADGLEPAGDSGGYFQAVPLARVHLDTTAGLTADGVLLRAGRDVLPAGIPLSWFADSVPTLYAGVTSDSATWPTAEQAVGKLLVMQPPPGASFDAAMHSLFLLRHNPRFRHVAGFAVVARQFASPAAVERMMTTHLTTDTLLFHLVRGSLLVTPAAADALIGTPLGAAPPGQAGRTVSGAVAFRRYPLPDPVQNVVAVLRGSDPALRDTYVALTAHLDHLGVRRPPLDPDSVRAFNRVMRPLGADTPPRAPTTAEAARIAAVRDSLRGARPPRLDSVFNGADDDASGIVALVELARVMAAAPRPRRSILFVATTAEELGQVGSRWYTDHPTVPRHSIVAEVDLDMIGRKDAADRTAGGRPYLQAVGSRRLSSELGGLLDSAAAHQPTPFQLDTTPDERGNPLRRYCRGDLYSFARYGIPSVGLSTGLFSDYAQVTDEPQAIRYDLLARVTATARSLVLAVANLDHRPVVDGPRGDPRAPCHQ